jgi:hypothetical protein
MTSIAKNKILVITYWKSIESVRSLTGGVLTKAYVPPEIAEIFHEYDVVAEHYDVMIEDKLFAS